MFETRLNDLYNTSQVFDVNQIDDYIIDARKTYHKADDAVSRLLDTSLFNDDRLFEEYHFVDFFRYSNVKLEDMYAYLDANAPWVRPADTGRSTNCLINELGIYIHKRERGFHNYALPYSWDVRMGHKTRKEALEELDDRINRDTVRKMLKEIGYEEDRLQNEASEKWLVAYLVTHGDLSPSDIRKHLAARLPEYMIPADFVVMDKLPLTGNGKVDRKALPDPDGLSLSNRYAAPRNEMERRIAGFAGQVLGKKQVSVKDSFFEIGGHSLKAVQLIARLNREFSVNLNLPAIYAHPTVEKLALHINKLNKAEFSRIEEAPAQEYYPVSWNQLNYLGKNRLGESVVTGHRGFEKLNKPALQKSIEMLVVRHESLRTVFPEVNGTYVQEILPLSSIEVSINELDITSEENKTTQLALIKASHVNFGFSLQQFPLFKLTLVKVSDDSYEFFVAMHHIIFDGWSSVVLINELDHLYESLSVNALPELSALPVQYKDFSVWQRRLVESADSNVHRDYWNERLRNGLPAINLPFDEVPGEKGLAIYTSIWDDAIGEKLKHLANEQSGSLYTTFLTGLNILLAKISGSPGVLVISPVAGREHEELQNAVGFFVNFLLLTGTVSPGKTFRESLSEVSRDFFEALSHQVYPVEKIFTELDVRTSDLTSVVLNMHNFEGQESIAIEKDKQGHRDADFEAPDTIAFIINDLKGGLEVSIVYRKDLFKPATIESFCAMYRSILLEASQDPDKRIGELEVLPAVELSGDLNQIGA